MRSLWNVDTRSGPAHDRRPGGFPPGDVLAHRGMWSETVGGNTAGALLDAVAKGLGVETDIRDRNREIIISHDPGAGSSLLLENFLGSVPAKSEFPGLVALNVKADGLVPLLTDELGGVHSLGTVRHFFFDMSIPETLKYLAAGLPVALRVSEYEQVDTSLRGKSQLSVRLWVDCFESDWFIGDGTLLGLLELHSVTLVSPEIHGRDPRWAWDWVHKLRQQGLDVSICTDTPLEFLRWS